MDRSDFSFLIARLERQAAGSPGGYAFKVAALAMFGYVTIFAVVAAILGCVWLAWHQFSTGGSMAIKLGIGCVFGLITLGGLVRALWVSLGEPESLRITLDQAPRLFATLDELRAKMGGIRLHSVSVSDEFNACIMQVPRWGVFGNYRNHLEIGLPLAAALSEEELKAVLAHEMGHLSGAHGKFGAWIYRQRVTWRALAEKFEDPSNVFEQLLSSFYVWYSPYFYAYTFVLARSQEYEADRAAAEATSARAMGASLVKSTLIGRFLGEVFWKRLYDQVGKSPHPPYTPYSTMPRAFKIAEKEWARKDWMEQSLRDLSSDDDTHPSLAERLGALGIEPALPAHNPQRSALLLFEPIVSGLVKHFDDRWRQGNEHEWRIRHAALQAQARKAS